MNGFRVFSAIVLLAFGQIGTAEAQDGSARPAKVTTVTASGSVLQRSYPALVLPSREIELSFKVSGQVVDLPVRAASQVRAGDVIARIDPRDYQSQKVQLESQRDQAAAQLEALRAGARPEDIVALEAAVDSAQAQVDQARDALARAQQLLDRGVSTRVQVDTAQADLRVAQANLRAQEEQLRIGQIGGRPEEIAAAEAVLRGMEAQVTAAGDSVEDTVLTAPFDGIIARRDIENFTNVQAGQNIVLLQGLDVVHLAFDIPGPDVVEFTRLGVDQVRAKAVFSSLPDQTFDAELIEFSVQADSATQTYRGRAAVVVPEGEAILPGMVARVIAQADGRTSQVYAPLTAIAANPDGSPFVWLTDAGGKVAKRAVTLGDARGGEVAVTDGLDDGDTIISAGVGQIIDGMTVRPIAQVGN